MVFPWIFPWIFPWFSHGFPMVFPASGAVFVAELELLLREIQLRLRAEKWPLGETLGETLNVSENRPKYIGLPKLVLGHLVITNLVHI